MNELPLNRNKLFIKVLKFFTRIKRIQEETICEVETLRWNTHLQSFFQQYLTNNHFD